LGRFRRQGGRASELDGRRDGLYPGSERHSGSECRRGATFRFAAGSICGIFHAQYDGMVIAAPLPTGSSGLQSISEGGSHMKRALAVVIALVAVQALQGCATAAGAAVGAGIGHTQGKTGEGAAIGAGVGAIYDITH
jgi:hypothetical protein